MNSPSKHKSKYFLMSPLFDMPPHTATISKELANLRLFISSSFVKLHTMGDFACGEARAEVKDDRICIEPILYCFLVGVSLESDTIRVFSRCSLGKAL